MTRNILLGIMLFLLSTCGKTKEPEKGVLTEKQMVNVMTELYLAEEKMNKLGVSYDSLKKLFPRFSNRAFEKAGIADSVFRKSMDYYMEHPDKLEDIYTTVVDSLNLKAQRSDIQKKNASSK